MIKKLSTKLSCLLLSVFVIPLNLNLDPQITPTIDTNEYGIPEAATFSSKNEMVETSLRINLPEVKILPDSPFYQAKRFIEDVKFMFARTPQQQLGLLVEYGQSRLSEGLQLFEKKKNDLAEKMLAEHKSIIDRILSLQEKSADSDQNETIPGLVENQQHKNELLGFLLGEYQVEWSKWKY